MRFSLPALLPVLAFTLCGTTPLLAQPAGEKPAAKPAEVPAPKADPKAAPAPDAKPAIKSLGGNNYALNGITFNSETRAITFPAKVNMVEGLLEYAIVHESGKAHESFLTTTVSPYDLNVVLLLVNFKPSANFFDLSDKKAGAILVKNPKIEPAAKLSVSLKWKDAAGPDKTAALESLLLNIDKKGPATDGPFTYTGSMLMEDGTFMAKETGSILALYADAAALVNNPREGNENDDVWITDKKKTPPLETAVTVTLSPAK